MYRDEEAEEVERYAMSKEGLEESWKEIEEACEPDGEALAAGQEVSTPLAPKLDEPSRGRQETPAVGDQSEERGAGGVVPTLIEPLPWDGEEDEAPPEGRILRKILPPETAVNAKRARVDMPAGGGASSSSAINKWLNKEWRRSGPAMKLCTISMNLSPHGDESMEADDEAMESDETSAPEVVAAAWSLKQFESRVLNLSTAIGQTIGPTFEQDGGQLVS